MSQTALIRLEAIEDNASELHDDEFLELLEYIALRITTEHVKRISVTLSAKGVLRKLLTAKANLPDNMIDLFFDKGNRSGLGTFASLHDGQGFRLFVNGVEEFPDLQRAKTPKGFNPRLAICNEGKTYSKTPPRLMRCRRSEGPVVLVRDLPNSCTNPTSAAELP